MIFEKWFLIKMNSERIYSPIIELQASWIAINPIQGCPMQCKYCFLRHQNQTGVAPVTLIEDKEQIVANLLNYKYYLENIPLAFFTHTDAFATPKNREFLLSLLYTMKKHKIPNIKCFITKCAIPKDFLEALKSLIDDGEKIIVYISYSGLGKHIEKGVNHINLVNSLEMLKNYCIPVIHYWRPFIPENSNQEVMLDVMTKMFGIAKASVVTGLNLYPQMKENLDFWPELQNSWEKAQSSTSIYPKGTYSKLNNLPAPYKYHPIFQSNLCAISYVHKLPDIGGFWKSNFCNNFNICPDEQRNKCNKFHKDYSINQDLLTKYLLKLNILPTNIKFTEQNPTCLIISNQTLTLSEIAFLRFAFQIEIKVERRDSSYWHSSMDGSHLLEID